MWGPLPAGMNAGAAIRQSCAESSLAISLLLFINASKNRRDSSRTARLCSFPKAWSAFPFDSLSIPAWLGFGLTCHLSIKCDSYLKGNHTVLTTWRFVVDYHDFIRHRIDAWMGESFAQLAALCSTNIQLPTLTWFVWRLLVPQSKILCQ